ncbi:MAG TPA: serine hydrolase domain-containing protein, partial [Anaerolineales bacterium]|nr:serine hydrolase domain-containing protein [Anaerolineales bacterium]
VILKYKGIFFMKWIKSHPWWTGVLTVLLAFIVFFFYTDLHLLLRSRPADMDSAITQEMQSGKVPGAAMLLIRDGKIESAKGYGLADPETGLAMTPDTLFTIASISKTMTATALMTLYEQGAFELDDDINKYLPFEVRNPNFPDKPITFRMPLMRSTR